MQISINPPLTEGSSLVEAVADVMDDRGARRAAAMVRDLGNEDELWDSYLGPMLDRIEDDWDDGRADAQDSGFEQARLAQTSFPLGDITLVYRSPAGEIFHQPVSDITECGTLIDPETGDDMDLVEVLVADARLKAAV
ncbi:MAG: hypothetical protein LBG60_04975 [Bifidobacteriaceae bacterium]|nr:hypothetical protein [Bifidobacteriaceae bacterium]